MTLEEFKELEEHHDYCVEYDKLLPFLKENEELIHATSACYCGMCYEDLPSITLKIDGELYERRFKGCYYDVEDENNDPEMSKIYKKYFEGDHRTGAGWCLSCMRWYHGA